jgi:hypothetical protein
MGSSPRLEVVDAGDDVHVRLRTPPASPASASLRWCARSGERKRPSRARCRSRSRIRAVAVEHRVARIGPTPCGAGRHRIQGAAAASRHRVQGPDELCRTEIRSSSRGSVCLGCEGGSSVCAIRYGASSMEFQLSFAPWHRGTSTLTVETEPREGGGDAGGGGGERRGRDGALPADSGPGSDGRREDPLSTANWRPSRCSRRRGTILSS